MYAMTPDERVRAAINGEPVDRVPLCFWHHFAPEGSGERAAEATLNFFYDTYKLDVIKIMPDLPYPQLQTIETAEQMRFLPRLGLDTPAFREQLLCVRTIRARVGAEYPLLLTLFSPLTYAMLFMGKQRALAAARKDPAPFEEGLGTLAANLHNLIEAAIDNGASGIFLACMGATSADLTLDEYDHFGRTYDQLVLNGAREGWLNVVHIHAEPQQVHDQIYFDLFANYPVQVLSWSDHVTGPTLGEALALTDKCLMGGLSERGPLAYGGEAELKHEMAAALHQTQGRRLILANGCSLPDDTPDQWLTKARRLLDTAL
jgi:Uroporphyrinogen-III decarboxylase